MPCALVRWASRLQAAGPWAQASLRLGGVLLPLVVAGLVGCGEQKTIIPSGELTEEQKQAIKAEDAKIAEEEGHGRAK
jgi:hypothetical protein